MIHTLLLTLSHNKTISLQNKPPRFSCLALMVVWRQRSFKGPLFEVVVTVRGTLSRKLVTEGVPVESTEVSLSIRGEGTGETGSDELALAFTHSWNCDKEDRRRFQS